MSYMTRKWPIARAEVTEEDNCWIAESRAGTGTWVICEDEATDTLDFPIRGAMFEFDEEQPGVLLPMTPEQREALKMPDSVYHELEVQLRLSYKEREEKRHAS